MKSLVAILLALLNWVFVGDYVKSKHCNFVLVMFTA